MTYKNRIKNFGTALFSVSFILILLILATSVFAHPPLPTEFYGKAQIFNQPAASGTVIKAYDSSNNICGTFTITKVGYYGVLSCNGKDTNGTGLGPTENESITFKINTYVASLLPNDNVSNDSTVTWSSGEYKYVSVVAPVLVCGDGFCDNRESCSTCVVDCGTCPSGTGDTGSTSGGGGSSSSSGSSSSTSSGSAISSGFPQQNGLQAAACEESWTCLEWSSCYANGTMDRSCKDLNECGTTKYKPNLVENCTFINQTRPTSNETTPQINETPSKPKKENPALISTCDQKMNPLSAPSVVFIALFLAILISSIIDLVFKIRKIRKQKKKDEDNIGLLEKEFQYRKETYIFMIVVSVMSAIVYFYHFFFYLCEDKYLGQLWFLGVLILVAPLFIHFIINLMKYHESEKLTKLKLLKDTHYQHFKKMIEITNNHLDEAEERIIKSIDALEEKEDFHKLLEELPEVSYIYKDMNKLFELYKLKKNSSSIEKDLLLNIDTLSKDDYFKRDIKEHPELNDFKTDLVLLFNMYKTKQELYDEIYKLEVEYEKEELLKSAK